MGIVVPDIVCLREPNLLIPGKKPIGNIRIERAHDFNRNILDRYIFGISGRERHNLARTLTLDYLSQAYETYGSDGRCFQGTAADGAAENGLISPTNYSSPDMQLVISLRVGWTSATTATRAPMVMTKNSLWSGAGGFSIGKQNNSSQFIALGDANLFGTYGKWTLSPAPFVANGDLHNYTVWYDSANNQATLWYDGIDQTTKACTGIGTYSKLCFGDWPNPTHTDSQSWLGPYASVAIHHDISTKAEAAKIARAFHADPYVGLEPA